MLFWRKVQMIAPLVPCILSLDSYAVAAEDKCTAILAHGGTIQETDKFDTKARALNNFLCASNITSEEDFHTSSNNYGWDSDLKLFDWFDGTGNADIGNANTNSRKAASQNFLCQAENYQIDNTSMSRAVLKTISKAVIDAWSNCINEPRSGLRLGYEFSGSKDFVRVIYQYNRGDGPDWAEVTKVDPDLSKRNLDCKLPEPKDLIRDRDSVICTRDPYTESQFSIKPKEMGVVSITIPALPKEVEPIANITGHVTTDALAPDGKGNAGIIFVQTGNKVIWTLPSIAWNHIFVGSFVSPTTIVGRMEKTNHVATDGIEEGCRVVSVYTIEVSKTTENLPHLTGSSEIIGGDITVNGVITERNVACSASTGALRCNVTCGGGPGIDSTISR